MNMKKHNIFRNDVWKFLLAHETWAEGLKIPDMDAIDYFNPTDGQMATIKHQVYSIYRLSFDQLVDYIGSGLLFDDAYREIKKHGFCLPFRIIKWGWREPETLDELEDQLKKLHIRHEIVFTNSKERIIAIDKTIQRKIIEGIEWDGEDSGNTTNQP